MVFCKTALLPLRVMLFSFYGGISCVVPFISLHMSTLGLTADDVSWLQFILPFVGCAGPLVGAIISDRLANYKPVLVVSLLVCAAAYPCMMLVPKVAEPEPPPSDLLTFLCSDQGSLIASEKCEGEMCGRGDGLLRGYYVEQCMFDCDKLVAMPSGLPHLCMEADNRTVCELVADVGDGLVVNASLPRVIERAADRSCWYPMVDFESGGDRYSGLTCRSPPGCRVRCSARQLSADHQLFSGEKCNKPSDNRQLTFWLYFGLRAATELCLPLALVLINATALLLRRRHDSDLGWELVWALLGLMTFAPICGYLIDVHGELFQYLDFRPSFYVFCALMLICVILASVVPVQPSMEGGARQYCRHLSKTLCNFEFFGVVCVLVLLGTLWGFLETFLYGHMRALGGTQLQNGLSMAAGAVLLLPFLIKAEALVNYCGHHHIFIIAFILYIVRYVSYAYIVSPWLALVAESLEMFTLHLVWLSAVLFTSSQSAPAIDATTQAVVVICHYGIGRGLGAGVVRYLRPLYSGFLLLCAGSVLAAAVAVLYMMLYYCCRAIQPRARGYGRHKQEMYSSNGAMLNGSYTPLKHRHNGCC